jgi:hypothetical protein|tara:strand:+ start:686 stop:886 length:201 start_codon:yes stop_codon:yes gene_type:complete
MKQVILQHGEMITVVGALVGIGAFAYGTYRFIRSEDRARLERMDAISLVVGGLFLTASCYGILRRT